MSFIKVVLRYILRSASEKKEVILLLNSTVHEQNYFTSYVGWN